MKDGFYNGKEEPRLDIKAKEIPALSKPNAPFMAMDEDVYKRFSEDEGLNLELTAAAANKVLPKVGADVPLISNCTTLNFCASDGLLCK